MERWPSTLPEARRAQETLRSRVRIRTLDRKVRLVAGADASYRNGMVYGAVCLYSYPELDLIEAVAIALTCSFPYVSGYLSFREGPALESAITSLTMRPDVIIFDGQGIAHPLGFGIASHMGVLLKIPTVGCAKSRLYGKCREPGIKRGGRSVLTSPDGDGIGFVLRTRQGVKPLYVSPGHMLDVEAAAELVLSCSRSYRLPEPLRIAHSEAGKAVDRLASQAS